MKAIDIITAMIMLAAASSCTSCDLRHESKEPDPLPKESACDTIRFRSGQECEYGYTCVGNDTTFANAIAWHVTIDGVKYKTSRRVHELIDEYYLHNVRYDFEGVVVGDSIEMRYAKSSLLIDECGSSYSKEILLYI